MVVKTKDLIALNRRAFNRTIRAAKRGDCKTAMDSYINGQRQFGLLYGRSEAHSALELLKSPGDLMVKAKVAFRSACKIVRKSRR